MKILLTPILLLTLILSSCTATTSKTMSLKVANSLVLQKNQMEFQLVQRHKKEIPSSAGKAFCEIGDITGGQTWITIYDDSLIVFEKSIHENDTLPFTFGREKYRIICLEMINELIGDDFATFKIIK